MEKTALGIGSNLGDSIRTCLRVFELLRELPGITNVRTSSLYRTKPVGFDAQDWFTNAVAVFETELDPSALLDSALGLERAFGRIRTVKWGPRTLDVDILFYGKRQVHLPNLEIPHPLLHERLFVLVPLAEVEPGWVHPMLGLNVLEMLDRIPRSADSQEIRKLDI
ncbi:MAG: 2-amino-4-hydroxy-6-hydroxymethyldihydropteridine diphosphokinase [Syntrophobacter sp.]